MNPASDWLSLTQEETIDPSLAICDPHHHLWSNRPNSLPDTYLLDQFLSDIHTGEHNIGSSVFIECGTMFSADGPVDLRPVGETQFANDIAAKSATGLCGPIRVAAGIVGTRIGTAGCQQFIDGVLFIYWNQFVAKVIPNRVERDGETNA